MDEMSKITPSHVPFILKSTMKTALKSADFGQSCGKK